MSCTSVGLTGGRYCTTGNPKGVPTGIILAKEGQSFTADDFKDEDKINTAIKNEQIFPIVGEMFKEFVSNQTEASYHEFADESRKTMRQGKYRFGVMLDLNECQVNQMLKFRGFRGRIYFIYEDWIRGVSTDSGTTVKGARTALVNLEKGTQNLTDGTAGTHQLVIDLVSEKDLNKYDYSREMSWDVGLLDGLTEVDIETTGTPTTTEIIVKVNANCYGDSLPITGLGDGHFIVSEGTITGVAESTSTPGEYTITGTSFATGTVNLAAPADQTTDLLIKSSGAASVSIS